MIKKDKKKSDYLTIKESREIIKYNIKQMKYYEAMKRRKLDESEYTLEMNDENNIIELDDLHTSFFTDRGSPVAARASLRCRLCNLSKPRKVR